MVPCVDLANHATGNATVALYDTDTNGNAVLLLQHGQFVAPGREITITYGDEKGACEMLFSYGFLEETMASALELFLGLGIPDDDPLKMAKQHVSKSPPGFQLFSQGGTIGWEGPFVWLLCVNEEDGLEFRLLQLVEGDQELKVFWKGREISDVSGLQSLLQAESKWDIFQLRAIVIIRDRIAQQLSALNASSSCFPEVPAIIEQESQINHYARRLRDLEGALMLQAHEMLEYKVSYATIPDYQRIYGVH